MHPFDDETLLSAAETNPNEKLRAELLERTVGKVRFRRRLHQVKVVGLYCLVFLAGVGTLALVRSPEVRIEREVVTVEVPAVVAKETHTPKLTAEEEWEADRQLIMVKNTVHYREAGDRYLAQGDHKSALRCYKKFLAEAVRDELKPAPTDTWLLSSLKRSRTSD